MITFVIAFIFDFINGFHDSANSIATIVGTRVLSPFAAVVWAAKGVDFLAPLKPSPPAEAHETAFPIRSVIVTIVLLKVAWM